MANKVAIRRKKSVQRNIIADISNPKGYSLSASASEKINENSVDAFTSRFQPEQQKLFRLYYNNQESIANISRIFDCTKETIHQRQQLLLHFLRMEFNDVYRNAVRGASKMLSRV